MNFFTVGDSHSWHGWMKIPGINTRSIGPMTMYRAGLQKPNVVGHIPNDGVVIFCWGEIDCRCHVHEHQPWAECIDEIVKNYAEMVRANAWTHPNAWIYNVVPPPRRDGQSEGHGNFPFLGTNEDRLNYVLYMNERLKKTGIPFIDVYAKYSDAEGYLNPTVSDDQVHVSNEKPLIEWMNSI